MYRRNSFERLRRAGGKPRDGLAFNRSEADSPPKKRRPTPIQKTAPSNFAFGAQ
jgi:hypothetical protein